MILEPVKLIDKASIGLLVNKPFHPPFERYLLPMLCIIQDISISWKRASWLLPEGKTTHPYKRAAPVSSLAIALTVVLGPGDLEAGSYQSMFNHYQKILTGP